MKELFNLLFHFKFKALFFEPTENGMIKFFRYCFVGGIAFVVDYAVAALTFILMGENTLSTVVGTTLGFIFGLIVNFALSKKFVFTEDAKSVSKRGEFLSYAIIGIVGLGLNILLMMLATEWLLEMNQFVAKIVVALIVLVYNFLARKILLY